MLAQKVSIEDSDLHPATSEFVLVHWCGCPVLLWVLLTPVEVKTSTGQAPGCLLTHALARQRMNAAEGF